MELTHPGPGEQLPQARLGVGRLQQFYPHTPVISYRLPAWFNDRVARCIPVHVTSVHDGRGITTQDGERLETKKISAALANPQRDDVVIVERFQLEYREGAPAEHHQTWTISREKVVTAVLGWATGEPDWKAAALMPASPGPPWRPCSCCSTPQAATVCEAARRHWQPVATAPAGPRRVFRPVRDRGEVGRCDHPAITMIA
ncbi:hypothetical protein ACIGO6_37980 [Streptomyces sp. NPDC053750]|uniref:hypothetical protein n=1 Tax=Streptomyces sp. NPDC053750 TaxID=3365714 RepID=UPI0037D71EA3